MTRLVSDDIAEALAMGSDVKLMPGSYLIELAFAEPVRLPLLFQALSNMGWENVTIDQSADMADPSTGALPIAALASKPIAAAAAKAVASSVASSVKVVAKPAAVVQSVQRTAPVVAPVAVRAPIQQQVVQPAAVAVRPVTSSVPAQKAVQLPISLPVVAAPKPNPLTATVRPVVATSLPAAKTVTTAPTTSSPTNPSAKMPQALANVLTRKPGVGLPKKPVGAPTSKPEAEAAVAAALEGGGGGGGGGASPGGSGPAAEYSVAEEGGGGEAPIEEAAPPAEPPPTVPELWRRWKDWGSPFAQGPGGTSVSGVETDTLARYRFVGTLNRPIQLVNQPGRTEWLYVHRLSLEPFGELRLDLTPYRLEHGKTYELRFMSRLHSQPTRHLVRETLAQMGFLPIKLAALKKNMRLPGRPGASFTLWYGVATWQGPDSMVVADDPFYFEDVKELP